VPALITALQDPASRPRIQAVIALGRLHDRQAVVPLIDLLEIEAASQAREAIADALHAITGEDFDQDTDRWRAWLEE
jgi:HEAT repeat protein